MDIYAESPKVKRGGGSGDYFFGEGMEKRVNSLVLEDWHPKLRGV